MKRTRIVITDDLDGSDILDPGHSSTTLAIDDHVVVLDLAPERRAQLAEALAPYLAAGRKVHAQAAGVRVSRVVDLPPGKRGAKRKGRLAAKR